MVSEPYWIQVCTLRRFNYLSINHLIPHNLIPNTEILLRLNEVTKLSLGAEYFDKLGQLVHEVAQADYTFITKVDEDQQRAAPLVSIKHGEFIENMEYSLEGTPCLEVSKTCVGYFPNNVRSLFPNDEHLKQINIEGYLGAAITGDVHTTPFAIITCLYEEEPVNPKDSIAVIQLIASEIENRVRRECLLLENYELRQDIDEGIRKITQSETLLKEIHHRVKNNLQIVASLLNLQKSQTTDPNVLDLINTSKDRIQSIALVHELLYSSDDFKSVDVKQYIEKITTNIVTSTEASNIRQHLEVDAELVDLDTLIPCGLILCEGLTNFMKYVSADQPTIVIKLKQNQDVRTLVIKDNGPGFPANILEGNDNSLGVSLIRSLAEQIDGEAKLYNDNGAVIEVNYPAA